MRIKLTKKFLKYEAGHEFTVIRKDKNAYVSKSVDTGKRCVVPKSKAEVVDKGAVPEAEPKETIVWLTPEQEPIVATLVVKKKVSAELIKELAEAYESETSLPMAECIDDVKLLVAYVKDPATVFKKESEKETAEVKTTMSTEEASVLEALLAGTPAGELDASKLSVTSDSSLNSDTPVKPKSLPKPKPKLKENQVYFTDITNGRLPKSKIDHIIDVYPSGTWAEEHELHIPEVDEHHFWDTEVLEAMVISYKLNEKILVTGMPGTGKSTSVKQFAAWIRQPYLRIGGRGDLESADIIGMGYLLPNADTGHPETIWKDGRLTHGVRYDYLVTIDEVMKIPSYIQMSMQHLYEKDGYLALDAHPGEQEDRILIPGSKSRIMLTDNVKGTGDAFDKYAATQIQDTSTLDRISINVTLDYMETKDETKMLKAIFKSIPHTAITKLVKFAGLVRKSYKQGEVALTLSPRGLLSILEMRQEIGLSWKKAIELAYLNKLADDSEAEAVRRMIASVKLED